MVRDLRRRVTAQRGERRRAGHVERLGYRVVLGLPAPGRYLHDGGQFRVCGAGSGLIEANVRPIARRTMPLPTSSVIGTSPRCVENTANRVSNLRVKSAKSDPLHPTSAG